jgi:pimeloyl-ACP methyl ester carboxylesterase
MKKYVAGSFALIAAAVTLFAETSPAVAPGLFFKPFQTDRAALAPDGKHLAYSERRGEKICLVIVDIEAKSSKIYPIADDEVEMLSGRKEKTPSRLTYLGWATDRRLVASLQDEVVFAIDADGSHFKELVQSQDLRRLTSFTRRRVRSGRTQLGVTTAESPSESAFFRTSRGTSLQGSGMEDGDSVAPASRLPSLDSGNMSLGDVDSTEAGRDFAANEDTSDLFSEGEATRLLIAPHVLELPPDDPDHIIVEARGRTGPTDDGKLAEPNATTLPGNDSPIAAEVTTSLFKVNIHTGRLTKLTDEIATSRLLSDKQGRPRLAVTHFGSERTFKIMPEPGGRMTPLEKLSPEMASQAFNLTPENFLGTRSFPLGFDYDPNVLYYASNVGRDTYGIFALDLKQGKRTDFSLEAPRYDLVDLNDPLPEGVLVYDRHRQKLAGVRYTRITRETRWLDPELRQLQRALDGKYPNAQLELLDWDRARTRFLVSSSNQADPGGFYLFEKASGKLVEYARRAPWLTPDQMFETLPFEVRNPAGETVSGYFTLPKQQRLNPVPLLVYCHDGPWSRDWPDYNRGVQALAAMGFAVAQVNYRGSAGFGQKHLNALREGYDRAALDDILAVVKWLQADKIANARAVAILGNGYGGYLALRGLQLHPDRFRCGVSINAPSDLPAWLANPPGGFSFKRDVRRGFFNTPPAALEAISPLHNAEKITKPLLIVRSELDTTVLPAQSLALERALLRNPQPPRSYRIEGEGHTRWLPGSQEKLFAELEAFFNETIYSYSVQLGETIELKSDVP